MADSIARQNHFESFESDRKTVIRNSHFHDCYSGDKSNNVANVALSNDGINSVRNADTFKLRASSCYDILVAQFNY